MKGIQILLLTLALVAVAAACQPAGAAALPPQAQAPDELYTDTGASLDPPSGSTVRPLPGPARDQPACGASCGGELPSGCTVFTVSKGDRVFFGGNDDYNNPDSFYWVEPPGEQGYGVVWIGTPGNVQQGVNEMGLAYDANGLPEVSVASHPERIPWTGGITSPQMRILHECATVEEVIDWVQTHQWHPVMNDQKQFADASGDAVIISPGPGGELVFTRKPPGDGYLVSSNFNVINPGHGYGYPCPRYEAAQAVLGQLLEGDAELTARDAASVLDAVHQEGGSSWTIASLVADLPNGLIYLYYFYQFDEPLVLNVAEELANPRDPGPLSYLFPDDVQQEAARRYRRIQASADRCRWTGMAWVPAVAGCLVLLVALSLGGRRGRTERRGLIFWVPVVAVLGPLGLLVWLVAGRSRRPGGWRATLLEAAGDVTPTAVAFAAFLALILLVPDAASSQLAQLVLVLGLPLAVGLLAFQGPLLALASKQGYLRTLGQRLPQALVAANLGMAGINALAAPLVNWCSRACSLFPSPGWTVGVLWAVIVVGALLGGVLLFLYEFWAARRGFRAWTVLASGEGQVRSPSWRGLWWWILLSYAALFGGLVASVALQQFLSA